MTSWAAGSLFYDTGYYGYENPYYVAAPASTTVVEYPSYDYSKPIITTEALPDVTAPAMVTAVSETDQARQAFYQGDYSRALTAIDAALAKSPSDIVLHEFRALALFALKRYPEAASTLYAVLSVGPGWDWTTMSDLYPDVDPYTQQLRALETFVKENPNSPDGHFVLAYQYMTAGHPEAALHQFKEVSRLLPKDQVAQQMTAMLSPAPQQPSVETSQPPATAIPERQPSSPPNIIGKWKAPAVGGGEVALSLADDGKFTWTHTRQGKSKSFDEIGRASCRERV